MMKPIPPNERLQVICYAALLGDVVMSCASKRGAAGGEEDALAIAGAAA